MSTNDIKIKVFDDFDDPAIGPDTWGRLLSEGDTDTINLTWQWQRTWWGAFGRGKLLLVTAERNGKMVALAPLFADEGMVYNLCPEDHLDFVGDISDPDVLDAILDTVCSHVDNFKGFLFYFIPNTSKTGKLLQEAANRLNLTCINEGSIPSPIIDIANEPDKALLCTRKETILRRERFFRREGSLEVLHMRDAEEILPHLEGFFNQHMERCKATPYSSIFNKPEQRSYYKQLTKVVGPTSWLRFTRVNWNGRAIAFHYGLCYRGRYLWGIPSFDIELYRHSPGMVLLRHAILDATEEGAHIFDFGMGDEAYKYRFATNVTHLHNWGLYAKYPY